MLMLSVAGLTVLTSHGNRGHLTPPLPMGVALTLGQRDSTQAVVLGVSELEVGEWQHHLRFCDDVVVPQGVYGGTDGEELRRMTAPLVWQRKQLYTNDTLSMERFCLGLHAAHGEFASIVERFGEDGNLSILTKISHGL